MRGRRPGEAVQLPPAAAPGCAKARDRDYGETRGPFTIANTSECARRRPGSRCSEFLQRALRQDRLDGLSADLDDDVVGHLDLGEILAEVNHAAGDAAHGDNLVPLG